MDEMKLDEPFASAGAGGPTHEVTLEFVIKQNDQPFVTSTTVYSHCSDPVVAFVTGNFVAMTAPLGPKGKKAANAAFSADLTVTVDGAKVGSGSWVGMTRERALLFEKQVLETWLHMNNIGTMQGKAYGQIPV